MIQSFFLWNFPTLLESLTATSMNAKERNDRTLLMGGGRGRGGRRLGGDVNQAMYSRGVVVRGIAKMALNHTRKCFFCKSTASVFIVFLAVLVSFCNTEDDKTQQVQGGWGGWPTGNGKKLSSSQAQMGQATYLTVA